MKPFPRWLIILSVLAMLCLVSGSFWFYISQERDLWQSAEANLQAAAQLKVNQIVQWRSERIRDAAVVMESRFLREAVERWFANPEADGAEKILSRLRSSKRLFGYRDVLLLDREGRVQLSLSGYHGPLSKELAGSLLEALQKRRPMLTELHTGPDDVPAHIDLIAPLPSSTDGHDEIMGAIIFQLDPRRFLYPLIRFWPTPSRSAETLLVRRHGDTVLFLNELRHQRDTALKLRIPLSRKEVPAVKAVLGEEGVVHGKDYRGVSVLSVLKAVPNTPWFMVAKVDEREALADRRFRSLLILGVAVGLLAALIAAVGMAWQKMGKTHYKELFLAEAALRKAEEGHRITLMSVGDGIISTDVDGRVELMNPVAEALTGWRREEAHGKPLVEVFPIFNEEKGRSIENPVSKVVRHGLVVGLANHTVLRARDGTKRPIADSAAPIRDERGIIIGIVLVFRDQSQERAAQRLLVQEKLKAQQYLDVAGVMLLALDTTGHVTLINRKGCKILGYEEQEVLGKDWFANFIPEEVRDKVKDIFSEIIADQVNLKEYEENHVLTRNGETRLLAWHNSILRDQDGSIIGTLSSGEDITARKRAEEELKRKTDLELAIAELSVKLLEPEAELGHIASIVLRQARSLTGSELGYVSSIDRKTDSNDGHTLTEVRGDSCGMKGSEGLVSFPKGPDGLYGGLWGHALNTRIPFFTNNPSEYPASTGLPEGHVPLRNFLSFPVVSKGLLLGQIALANKPDGYTDDDVAVVKRLAEIYGMFLRQWRLTESLKESEERFRQLYEQSPLPYQALDAEGNFLDVNDAWLATLGYERNEVMGKWFGEFLAGEGQARFRRRFEELKEKGEVHGVEYDLQRQDGTTITVSFDGRCARNEKGEFLQTHCVLTNVTEARLAEAERERLVSAIEQAAEAVVITDAEGIICYVNPAFEAITGYTSEEAIGTTPRLLRSGEHDAKLYKRLWDTIKAGNVWSGRLVNRKKDGSLYHEEATISPVKDSSGNIVNFVAVTRDMTEHLNLSRQLLQAQKMEAVGTLAGGVAHDFNNLLQIILGYSELLLVEKSEDDEEYLDLQKIFHAAKSGADLVHRLLAFSRESRSKPLPLNLNQQIVQVEKLLRRTIPRMVDIHLDLSPDLPEIYVDPSQVEQVLMNLALNARDAMPDGGKLTVRTSLATLDDQYSKRHLDVSPGDYVLLEVSDTGHGMDKETVEHIFEPFYTTKEMGRGTGLGLAMVYGIVKQHNGHITVSSEIGRGSTFRVYLPAMEGDVETDLSTSDIVPAFGTETILLVDDEEFVRELGSRILTDHGYTVLQAENGREALDLFEKEGSRIDAVILDLIMPRMGGRECLEGLLKIDPNVKVLVASGFSSEASVRETLQLGVRGFVSKPFRAKELLRDVHRVLEED